MAVRLVALAVTAVACASGPGTSVPVRTPDRAPLPELPVLAPSPCPEHAATLAEALPAAGRPRKLGPRGAFPVLVPGREEVAYVDRETGEAHVVPLRGGAPRRVSPSRRPPDLEARPDPEARGNGFGVPEPVTVVWPGPREGEITYRSGQEHHTVATREGAPPPVRADDPSLLEARRRGAFAAALARHGLTEREYLVPLSETHAVIVVGVGAALPAGLYAIDAATGGLHRASPPGLPLAWAPVRIDERRVAFGQGRHHYLLDAAALRLTCATAPLPDGFRPGPVAVTPELAWLGYGGYRDVPGGWELIVGLVELRSGEDRRSAGVELVKGATIQPIPGRAGFVLAAHRVGGGDLLAVEAGRGLLRLAAGVPGLGSVSLSERAVVFSREAPTTEVVPTARPEEHRRDSRMGCDPVPPMGGCGWVSNGCEHVFLGPCVRRIAPPDPADGIYAVDW